MEALSHFISPEQRNTVGQLAIRAFDPIAPGAQCGTVKVNHLITGMHGGVGAPCAADNNLGVGHRTEGTLELLLH